MIPSVIMLTFDWIYAIINNSIKNKKDHLSNFDIGTPLNELKNGQNDMCNRWYTNNPFVCNRWYTFLERMING